MSAHNSKKNLSDETVLAVYNACKTTEMTNIAIALEFGISDGLVSFIRLGRYYKHLNLTPLKRKKLSAKNKGKTMRDRLLEWSVLNHMTGCWEWNGCKNKKGYGAVYCNGTKQLAHRVSYQVFVGPIHNNLCVLHRCDNPKCCNPDHLFLGSQQDNMTDMVNKGRSRKFFTEK